MLSLQLQQQKNRLININITEPTETTQVVYQTSPTNYVKSNASMFDPSMSQTPPGPFTNTLKERIRAYFS